MKNIGGRMKEYDVYDVTNTRMNAISFSSRKEAQKFVYTLKNDKWARASSPPFKLPLKIKESERKHPLVTYSKPISYYPMRGEGQYTNYP